MRDDVTSFLLGASSVFCNGAPYSRVGTACVAMVAKAFSVPVNVCCEAYKFHERVLLDSICSNELGNVALALHSFFMLISLKDKSFKIKVCLKNACLNFLVQVLLIDNGGL